MTAGEQKVTWATTEYGQVWLQIDRQDAEEGGRDSGREVVAVVPVDVYDALLTHAGVPDAAPPPVSDRAVTFPVVSCDARRNHSPHLWCYGGLINWCEGHP